MKTNIFKWLATSLATAGLFSSCQEKPFEEPVADPASVTIEVTQTSTSAIAFTITPENAIKYSYAVAPSDEIASAEYTVVRTDEATTVEISDLKPATEYTIVANATNADNITCENITETAITTNAACLKIEVLEHGFDYAKFNIKPVNTVSYKYAVVTADTAEEAELTTEVKDGETHEYSVDNLNPGTRYTVVAQGVNKDGELSERAYGAFMTDEKAIVEATEIKTDENSATIIVKCTLANEAYYAITKKGENPTEDMFKSITPGEEISVYAYDLELNTEYTFHSYGISKMLIKGETSTKDFKTATEINSEYSVLVTEVTSQDAKLTFAWNDNTYSKAYFLIRESGMIDPETFDFDENRGSLYQAYSSGYNTILSAYSQIIAGHKYWIGTIFADNEDNLDKSTIIWKLVEIKNIYFGESDALISIDILKQNFNKILLKFNPDNKAVGFFFDIWSQSESLSIEDIGKIMIKQPWVYYTDFSLPIEKSIGPESRGILIPVDENGMYGKILAFDIESTSITLDGKGEYEIETLQPDYKMLSFNLVIGNNTENIRYIQFKDGEKKFDTEEKALETLAIEGQVAEQSGQIDLRWLDSDTEYNIWFMSCDNDWKYGNLKKFKIRTKKAEFNGTGSVAIENISIRKDGPSFFTSFTTNPDSNVKEYIYYMATQDYLNSNTDEQLAMNIIDYTRYSGIQTIGDKFGVYTQAKSYIVILPIDHEGRLCPLVKYKIEETF